MTSKEFAHEAHDSVEQKRKYSGDPYWVHTDEVADLALKATGSLICYDAGNLHDVLEDVFPLNKYYSEALIAEKYGTPAAIVVVNLTDQFTSEACPHLNRETRKGLEADRYFHLGRSEFGYETHSVKLCDLISNTRDIAAADPGFAKTYLKEKELLLHALYAGNAGLKQLARQTLENAKLLVYGHL